VEAMTTVDEVFGAGGRLLATACAAWLAVAVLLELGTTLPGRLGRLAGALARRWTPGAARLAMRGAVGLSSLTVASAPLVATAGADHGGAPPDVGRPASAVLLVTPPITERATRPAPPAAAPRDDTCQTVVTAGDTLWGIAADHLAQGAAPSAEQIAAAWPRWYERNRTLIGPDPHLLHPGQVLQCPRPSGTESGRSR